MNFLFGSKNALIQCIPPECRKLGWNANYPPEKSTFHDCWTKWGSTVLELHGKKKKDFFHFFTKARFPFRYIQIMDGSCPLFKSILKTQYFLVAENKTRSYES